MQSSGQRGDQPLEADTTRTIQTLHRRIQIYLTAKRNKSCVGQSMAGIRDLNSLSGFNEGNAGWTQIRHHSECNQIASPEMKGDFIDEKVSFDRGGYRIAWRQRCVCPGSRASCPASAGRGASSRFPGRALCVDRRLSPLGRPPLCLGIRALGCATPRWRGVGSRTLGGTWRRMGVDRRPLAVIAGATNLRSGAPCVSNTRRSSPVNVQADYFSGPGLGPALR